MKEAPKAPRITDDLVAWLDRLFPNTLPAEPPESLESLWFRAGKAAVVRRVIAEQRLQTAEATPDE